MKAAKIPCDWSLKISLAINLPLVSTDEDFLSQVRKCSDSDAMAKSVIHFVDNYSSVSKAVCF